MDIALASELIDTQFSELAPSRVVFLGEGCDSTALEVNGTWVFRFPKNGEVERQLEIEARILPMLAARLPVAVPDFRFHGTASPRFGRRFCGYRKLPGQPALHVAPDALAATALIEPLGRLLSALHAFPIAEATGAGVPEERLDALIAGVRDDALGDLPRVSGTDPGAPIDRWRPFIEAGVAPCGSGRRTLVHNDLAAEHVLLDPDAPAITGVIDWSDIAISDPVVDFAGLFHWGGEPLVRGVLEAYDGHLDEDALQVARYLAACRGAMDVRFGLDHQRAEYVGAGLRALQLCAFEPAERRKQ